MTNDDFNVVYPQSAWVQDQTNKQTIEKISCSLPCYTFWSICWFIFSAIWQNKYIIDPRPLQPLKVVDPSLQSLFTDLTQMNFYAAQFWKLMEDGHARTISQTQSNELYFPQKRIFLPSLRYFSVLWAKSPLLWQVEGKFVKIWYWLIDSEYLYHFRVKLCSVEVITN